MTHHPILSSFSPVSCVGTGQHVFDFIGSKTHSRYRKGWHAHTPSLDRKVTPSMPALNEHYFDWVTTLEAVKQAKGCFRMAELGAGWAPWLVRAGLACRQMAEIESIELVAVEADETHHAWVEAHLTENGFPPSQRIHALRGAIAAQSGVIRFPKIANPDENYGASTRSVTNDSDWVEVPAYSLEDVFDRFSGPLDFMHVDIQGAEYDVLPPAMELLNRKVKSMMVGTHLSSERHHQLASQLKSAGWIEVFNFPRNEVSQTSVGEIPFGDGFLYFRNPFL